MDRVIFFIFLLVFTYQRSSISSWILETDSRILETDSWILETDSTFMHEVSELFMYKGLKQIPRFISFEKFLGLGGDERGGGRKE